MLKYPLSAEVLFLGANQENCNTGDKKHEEVQKIPL